MKLLIVTQIVDKDDPVLGFFHRWIEEFAKHVEKVTVICLKEGARTLPNNVTVHSLGKEKGSQPAFIYAQRFLHLSWKYRNEYDAVFVHMNHEYLLISGWFWKLRGIRTALWYTHGSVPFSLRVASLFSDKIFTASHHSLRLETRKKKVMGHGLLIDNRKAHPVTSARPVFVTVSRVSRVKNIHVMLEALARIPDGQRPYLKIVGGPVTSEDELYFDQIRSYADAQGLVSTVDFLGPRTRVGVIAELEQAHAFLHLSATGSLDKAPLEALAMGVPVISSNPEVGEDCPAVRHVPIEPEAVTQAIREYVHLKPWEDANVPASASAYISTKHELGSLVRRIVAELG